MRRNAKKAMEQIGKIQQLMSRAHYPYRGKTKQAIIDEIRKTREKLWEEKLAAHSRQ